MRHFKLLILFIFFTIAILYVKLNSDHVWKTYIAKLALRQNLLDQSDKVAEKVFKLGPTNYGSSCGSGVCISLQDVPYKDQHGIRFYRIMYTRHLKNIHNLTTVELEIPKIDNTISLFTDKWQIKKSVVVSSYTKRMLMVPFYMHALSNMYDVMNFQKVLLIGGAGGAMSNFLSSLKANIHVTLLEDNIHVARLAQSWFRISNSSDITYIVQPGNTVLEEFFFFHEKFNVVFVDASCLEPSDLIAPPKEFQSPNKIKVLSDILDYDGVLVVHIMASKFIQFYDQAFLKLYSNVFLSCYLQKIPENPTALLLICSKKDGWKWSQRRAEYEKDFKYFNKKFNFDLKLPSE